MDAPQIVLIVLWAVSLGIHMRDHGKPKTGTESVWQVIISLAIINAILWWGGWYS